MIITTPNGTQITATSAVKGSHSLNVFVNDNCILSVAGDVSGYSVSGGNWTEAPATAEDRIAAVESAALDNMYNIILLQNGIE